MDPLQQIMKPKNIVWLALIFSLIAFAVPALHAGEGRSGAAPYTVRSGPSRTHRPLYGEAARAQSPCCARCCSRRCARLMEMAYRRGCLCPEVARALQPVRSHTYLSNHYPPYRYGR